MVDYQAIIDRHYPSGSMARGILLRHSRSVARLALRIARRLRLPLDEEQIRAGAMLHDVGICLCDAPSIGCRGRWPYLQHGLRGSLLLKTEGAPLWAQRIARRHTGVGLSPEQATRLGLPTHYIYEPRTQLERLICYADKFYSKSRDMRRKPLARVRASLQKFGPQAVEGFEALHREFGRRPR